MSAAQAGDSAGDHPADAPPMTAASPRPAAGPAASVHVAAPRDLGTVAGYRVWSAAGENAQVRFVGLGPHRPFGDVLTAITGDPGLETARLKQIHSADVRAVDAAGVRGEGDALYTRRRGLAVAVVTADCVPVLVEAGDWVAAIHAGWRGLVAGVIPETLERLQREGAGDPAEWRAWIGPVNGACCYEVGRDVADQVMAATGRAAVVERPRSPGGLPAKPHLDLIAAARVQLTGVGVPSTWVVRCTQCDAESLHSYRRNGERAGRNLAYVWKS